MTKLRIKTEELKYSIKSKLTSIPHKDYLLVLSNIWSNGINKKTFYRWWNIKKESKESIPSDSLLLIANVLDCTMNELYNERN
jgi:hypothetical protein